MDACCEECHSSAFEIKKKVSNYTETQKIIHLPMSQLFPE